MLQLLFLPVIQAVAYWYPFKLPYLTLKTVYTNLVCQLTHSSKWY